MKQELRELNSKKWQAVRGSLRSWVLPALLVTVMAGCARHANVAASTDPSGTYMLATVGGKSVPCTVEHEGHSLTVKSGSFIIKPDGTCASKIVFAAPGGGDASREVEATYTRKGATLTMQWKGAGTTSGTVEGDTFTMNNEGMIFAYRK